MIKAMCIGEILWDIFPSHKVWGGAPANFIFHMAQFGAQAWAITAIGRDDLGSELLKEVQATGVEVICAINHKPTGKVHVTLDSHGAASYLFNEDCAWDHIPFTEELADLCGDVDLLCFGTLAQRHADSRSTLLQCLKSRKPSAKVLFDINLRQQFYSKEIIETSLRHTNYLKLNDEEEIIITKMFGKTLKDLQSEYAIELVILTLGDAGSRIISPTQTYDCPAVPCKVVDTVGAGDAFTASFIMGYLTGLDIPTAQQQATRVASYVCAHAGATIKI
jgi:fructokinase